MTDLQCSKRRLRRSLDGFLRRHPCIKNGVFEETKSVVDADVLDIFVCVSR